MKKNLLKRYSLLLGVLSLFFAGGFAFAQTNTITVRLDKEDERLLQEATTDSWFKKEAFASALLGGLTAVVAAWCAYRWELRKEKEADKAFNMRVLDAIHTELKTLLEIYNTGAGSKLKDLKEGEIFPYWLHFSQRHFVIYETNVLHIGKIDSDLAKQLIRVHGFLKVLVESFGINSHYIMDLRRIEIGLMQQSNDKLLAEQKRQTLSIMVPHTQKMKREYEKLMIEVGIFFERFEELKLRQRSK